MNVEEWGKAIAEAVREQCRMAARQWNEDRPTLLSNSDIDAIIASVEKPAPDVQAQERLVQAALRCKGRHARPTEGCKGTYVPVGRRSKCDECRMAADAPRAAEPVRRKPKAVKEPERSEPEGMSCTFRLSPTERRKRARSDLRFTVRRNRRHRPRPRAGGDASEVAG